MPPNVAFPNILASLVSGPRYSSANNGTAGEKEIVNGVLL